MKGLFVYSLEIFGSLGILDLRDFRILDWVLYNKNVKKRKGEIWFEVFEVIFIEVEGFLWIRC